MTPTGTRQGPHIAVTDVEIITVRLGPLGDFDAEEIDVVGGGGFQTQAFAFAVFGTGELDGGDGSESVGDAGGDVFPHLVVRGEPGLEAEGDVMQYAVGRIVLWTTNEKVEVSKGPGSAAEFAVVGGK